jgi:hypothetical protein
VGILWAVDLDVSGDMREEELIDNLNIVALGANGDESRGHGSAFRERRKPVEII